MTSSSEEDNLDLIKEAVDPRFSNNSLFAQRLSTSEKDSKQVEKKPSLRRKEQNDSYFVKVTPEFQDFVFSCLEKRIEKELKEKPMTKIIPHSENNSSSGIKLFSNSSIRLTEITSNESPKKRPKRPTKMLNEKKLTSQCSQVAIQGDWILNGESIKGWAKSTKGEVIILDHQNHHIKKEDKSFNLKEKANRKRLKQIEKRKKKKIKLQNKDDITN